MTIQPLDFKGHEVRVILDDDGEPRWVASDVAKVLGYRSAPEVSRFVRDRHKGVEILDTPGGRQKMTVLNEAGLYAAIMKSRAALAEQFQDWVTDEVLPAIRKTGSYGTPALSGKELLAAALLEAQSTMQELQSTAQRQAIELATAAPKVEYHDTYVAESDQLSFRTVASTLGLKETELREILIKRGWIYRETSSRRSQKTGDLVPQNRYSEYSDKKPYFIRRQNHDAPRFRGEVDHTLKITPAGAAAITRAVKKWEATAPGQTSLEVNQSKAA